MWNHPELLPYCQRIREGEEATEAAGSRVSRKMEDGEVRRREEAASERAAFREIGQAVSLRDVVQRMRRNKGRDSQVSVVMQSAVEIAMWAGWAVVVMVVMGLPSLELHETQQQQDEGKHTAGAAGKRDLAWHNWPGGVGHSTLRGSWLTSLAWALELTTRCGWSARFCLPVGPASGDAQCGGRHHHGHLKLISKTTEYVG
jgi:hypothetical protein